MAIAPSDIVLVLPEFNSEDMFRKVGGLHTTKEVDNGVDSVFLPGTIVGDDSSDSYRYQYRKVFIKNKSGYPLYNSRVWGYNVKACNFVKFTPERDVNGVVKIDGSEAIKDYTTRPSMWDYNFTECHSDNPLIIGNMSDGQGIGLWLEQKIPKNSSEIPSDNFRIGFNWTDTL